MYNGEYGVSTDENGLYYMRARYYNPEIKRFINQDVVIGLIADSPSLNRYAYVQGNPISLADPFGLSPGIDWRGAAHFLLGGLSLLTLIPTPVTYIIGATASIVNAALYAEEGNYFAAICNAIPVFGGGFGLVGKLEKPTCWLMKTLQYSTAGLSIGTGAYDIYQIGKENYQKYVVEGKKLSWDDVFSDLFRGGLDVASIAGGAKLATEQIPKTSNSDPMDYRKDTREYLSEGGGRIATTKEVRAYKKSWNQRGIKVVTDMKERRLVPGAAAGFDYESAEIIIRKKPSLLSLYHEGFHAQQFLEIGKEEYMAIGSLAREEYVYNQLVSSGLCNEAELLNAKAYIERLRFMG